MPRAEVGTPKWLANKMKAKGLQRLRWYCQMCEKQCRDENGFKCHRMSEGHQRQMQVFMQRANRYIDDFSREFEATFMQLMRTRYCRTRVLANTVYCELISDKQHIHMNATRWATLSEFVLYLKRSNKCIVERSEQGWYLEYIDREKLDREARELAERKNELSCEQRRNRILKKKMEEAWRAQKELQALSADKSFVKPFVRKGLLEQENSCITIKLDNSASNAPPPPPQKVSTSHVNGKEGQPFSELSENLDEDYRPVLKNEKKKCALDQIILENETRKKILKMKGTAKPSENVSSLSSSKNSSESIKEHSFDPEEPWIAKGLVVRVLAKEFANGRFFREKGVIEDVEKTFVAKIYLPTTQDIILLDQNFLEPVVPSHGGRAMILQGPNAGSVGSIHSVDINLRTVILDSSYKQNSSTQNDSKSLNHKTLLETPLAVVQANPRP